MKKAVSVIDCKARFVAKRKSALDKAYDVLTKAGKILKRPNKMVSGAVIAAILGGLIKATALTQTFPEPWDTLGNVILFVAVILIVADIAKGGLYD